LHLTRAEDAERTNFDYKPGVSNISIGSTVEAVLSVKKFTEM